MQRPEQPLKGYVAVVVGATRGAGRGIAIELGSAGAIVYCTGRSTSVARSVLNRPETIEETAELVNAAGGVGIARRVDYSARTNVQDFFRELEKDQAGRLDILVNDIGGDQGVRWKTPFWDIPSEEGFSMIDAGIKTHLMAGHYSLPLMVRRRQGLVIEVTDGDDRNYRGSFYYDFIKIAHQRIAEVWARELEDYGVTAVALTPGFIRSEAVLDSLNVSEENWMSALVSEPTLAGSESPHFIGKVIVRLVHDPELKSKSGQTLSSWALADEYQIQDLDGTRPHWKNFYTNFKL